MMMQVGRGCDISKPIPTPAPMYVQCNCLFGKKKILKINTKLKVVTNN